MIRARNALNSYMLPSGELTVCNGKIHHFSWENPPFLWPFSIAISVHQRVHAKCLCPKVSLGAVPSAPGMLPPFSGRGLILHPTGLFGRCHSRSRNRNRFNRTTVCNACSRWMRNENHGNDGGEDRDEEG